MFIRLSFCFVYWRTLNPFISILCFTVELSRLWDFVEITAPGVYRDDPNSWYPTPSNTATNPEGQSPDPWPHSGWGFLPDMCQSFGAGWLFGELREKLADRVFGPLFGTSELHSSKEGFTFHRPTAPGVASNGAVHPFLDRERPRVAGKIQTKGKGEHFDQCAAHTGLQCIQSSTSFIDQDMDGADGCFQCWPRSHVEHPRMTKDIWRGRSDWVPLTDEELMSLEERGFSARKVPVNAGDVILWRSDLVHCGVGPSLPVDGFRSVSYTAMIPAAMTPSHVLREKIEHLQLLQTGDHRPNVTSRHFSAPKKKTKKKHKKSSQQESESLARGSYFADRSPVLTVRQAELYGLIPYNRKDDLNVDQLLKSLRRVGRFLLKK